MENSTELYIKRRIENRKERLDKDISEKELKQFIGLILSVLAVISGLCIITISPAIGLVIAEIAAASACLKYKNCKKIDSKELRIKEEIKHLEELEKGIDGDNFSKDKKSVKLMSLDESRRNAKEEYDKAKIITFLTYAVTTLGVGLTLVNPVAGTVTVLGILSNILAGNNEIKKYSKCEEIKNKISDLYHEIDVYKIQEGYISRREELYVNSTKSNKKKEDNIPTLEDYFEESYYTEEDKPKALVKRIGDK